MVEMLDDARVDCKANIDALNMKMKWLDIVKEERSNQTNAKDCNRSDPSTLSYLLG